MTDLDPKALEAAARALNSLWCPTCEPYQHTDDAHRAYCEKSARAAVSAYLAATGDGWLPIETAPKDGSSVLVSNRKYVSGGRYYRGGGPYDGTRQFLEEGYYREGASRPDRSITHWRPLPAPPALTAQEPRT